MTRTAMRRRASRADAPALAALARQVAALSARLPNPRLPLRRRSRASAHAARRTMTTTTMRTTMLMMTTTTTTELRLHRHRHARAAPRRPAPSRTPSATLRRRRKRRMTMTCRKMTRATAAAPPRSAARASFRWMMRSERRVGSRLPLLLRFRSQERRQGARGACSQAAGQSGQGPCKEKGARSAQEGRAQQLRR